jgi:hypothetical protein
VTASLVSPPISRCLQVVPLTGFPVHSRYRVCLEPAEWTVGGGGPYCWDHAARLVRELPEDSFERRQAKRAWYGRHGRVN